MVIPADPRVRCHFNPFNKEGNGRLIIDFPAEPGYLYGIIEVLPELLKLAPAIRRIEPVATDTHGEIVDTESAKKRE